MLSQVLKCPTLICFLFQYESNNLWAPTGSPSMPYTKDICSCALPCGKSPGMLFTEDMEMGPAAVLFCAVAAIWDALTLTPYSTAVLAS